MAQLVKEQAISGVFVAGKKALPSRMPGWMRCIVRRLCTGLAVPRMPIVHHAVPKAQALGPQQGQNQQHDKRAPGGP